jgi:hydroxyethylthiazole kinase
MNASSIWDAVQAIRNRSPVVHNITNFVVMNTTANALLALGASPVMAHAVEEVEEMVRIAGALVINIGTLSPPWVRAMFMAAQEAKSRNIPIILDPVGAGATSYRTQTGRELIDALSPEIIRGNASEILALCGGDAATKGVDSTAGAPDAVGAAGNLSRTYGSVICISGERDFVLDSHRIIEISGGGTMMTRVTGLGCTATALCGAFAAVTRDYAEACAQAMSIMKIAGQIAIQQSQGPGSLQVRFLDALYTMSYDNIYRHLQISEQPRQQ